MAPKEAGEAFRSRRATRRREIEATRENLGWPHSPFEVPNSIVAAWRAAGSRGSTRRQEWNRPPASSTTCLELAWPIHLRQQRKRVRERHYRRQAGIWPQTGQSARRGLWSQLALEHLVPACPSLIGGSADLTGSNGTRTKHHASIKRGSFEGITSIMACV